MRIRSVKPETATSEVLAQWPREVRYAFVLLWTYLDDEGRGLDVPKTIAGTLFPHDDDVTDRKMARWLTIMATPSDLAPDPPLCRYEVGGRKYLHTIHAREHQRPNRPSPSRLPACPTHDGRSEPLTEPGSDDNSEASLPGAVVRSLEIGAAAQRSEPPRGARQLAAAANVITHHTGASSEEATALAAEIQRGKNPRNLAALINALAKGPDLEAMLQDYRTRMGSNGIAAQIAIARKGAPCEHGEPGGASLHPATSTPLCPLCRKKPPS